MLKILNDFTAKHSRLWRNIWENSQELRHRVEGRHWTNPLNAQERNPPFLHFYGCGQLGAAASYKEAAHCSHKMWKLKPGLVWTHSWQVSRGATWHIVTRVMAECVSNIGHKFMVIFAQPERNASVWFMGNESQGPCRGRPCHIWFPSLWLLSSYVNMFSFYDQLLLGWYYVGFISHCFIPTLIKIFSSHKTGWVHHLRVARYK